MNYPLYKLFAKGGSLLYSVFAFGFSYLELRKMRITISVYINLLMHQCSKSTYFD
jgi:hypothetical protein